MDSKDIPLLQKLQQHTDAILCYCAACKSLADVEMNSMCMEAAVFNLMQIVWDTVAEDISKLNAESDKTFENADG